MSHPVVVFIAPTLRQAQGASMEVKKELMGKPIRIMSAQLAASGGLNGYGPGAELRPINSHRFSPAVWDAIQTCRARGASIKNGAQ